MTERGKFVVSRVITTRASDVRVPANLRTSRSLGGVGLFVMTERGVLFVGGVIATRAGHIRLPADVRTSRCLGFVGLLIMTERGEFVVSGMLTTRASDVRVPADLRTGRGFGFVGLFVMTERGNGLLMHKHAARTAVLVSETGFRARRGCDRLPFTGKMGGRRDRLSVFHAATTASHTFPRPGAGRSGHRLPFVERVCMRRHLLAGAQTTRDCYRRDQPYPNIARCFTAHSDTSHSKIHRYQLTIPQKTRAVNENFARSAPRRKKSAALIARRTFMIILFLRYSGTTRTTPWDRQARGKRTSARTHSEPWGRQ